MASTTRRSSARCARILRDQIEDKGGLQVDAVGDEVLAVFVEAAPAVEAALGAQRGFATTNGPRRERRGYASASTPARRRTARRDTQGSTWSVRRGSPSPATGVRSSSPRRPRDAERTSSTRDLGEHRMEGLQEPERVYQVLADDLPRDFPALRNTGATLGDSVRVVLADDTVLLREGVARLLSDAGFDVVAQSGNAGRSSQTRRNAQARCRHRRHPDAADAH